MRLSDFLTETGIRVAAIDLAARAVVEKAIPAAVDQLVRAASAHLPSYDEDDEERWSKTYDDLYRYYNANRSLVTDALHAKFSQVLTLVTREHVARLFKGNVIQHPSHGTILIGHLRVEVLGRVEGKWANGEFYMRSNEIKVYIDDHKVFDAAMGLIGEKMFGEDSESYFRQMVNTVVPVFVHEYAHLEQKLRNRKDHTGNDFGYITAGVGPERARQGRRGGIIRAPKSFVDYLRYKGNVSEIDAFAAQTVSELVQSIETHHHRDRAAEIDRAIRGFEEAMRYGYDTGSRSYDHYTELLHNAFAGHFAEHKLDPEQMRKVWQRFVKKVLQKLGDYAQKPSGKMDHYSATHAPKDYLSYAKSHGFAETVKEVAYRCAIEMMIDADVRDRAGLEDFRERYRSEASFLMRDARKRAESFLVRYYIGDPWEHEAAEKKLVTIFHKMLARIIETYDITA